MSLPELTPNSKETHAAALEVVQPHHQVLDNFTELELAINTLLFARILKGNQSVGVAIKSHQDTYESAEEWLPLFFKQMMHGWLLRQRAPQLHLKGERAILKKLNPLAVAEHVDAVRDTVELGTELSVAQFMGLLTLGLLSKLKSVNYATLQREQNLGGDLDILKKLSFWMFNWQPETIHARLGQIQRLGLQLIDKPATLAQDDPEKLLYLGHFVSALLVVCQDRSTELKRTLKRKNAASQVKNKTPFTILLPHGTKLEITESTPVAENGTIPDSAAEIPDAFFDAIEDIDFDGI